jgi:hypothetical protein
MVLLVTALSVGFMHTLLGPDHYVPFIVIGRARRWGPCWASRCTGSRAGRARGPCEPLIPVFFASAVSGDRAEVVMVTVGYTAATLAGMHLLVTLLWLGLRRIPLGPLERWSNAAAGTVIALAGAAMVFLGL